MRFDAVSMQRAARWLERRGLAFGSRVLGRMNLIVFSAYLPPSAEIGEGTVLGYGGFGIFLHPSTRIGRRCLISQYATFGGAGLRGSGAQVGDYVRIGVGARILGPVRVGDFSVIAANSVVTRDVPPGVVMFGIPARVVRTMDDPVAEFARDTSIEVLPDDGERFRDWWRRPRNETAPGASVEAL